MKIAVIGATGMIGLPVAIELVKAGFEITALVRDEEKAKSILPAAIHLVKGNIKDSQTLRGVFTGTDAIYLNLNLDLSSSVRDYQPEREGLQNIIRVAKECAVKRIAFISSVVMYYQGMNGFNWWVFELKHRAVQMIRDSGIPYTIFYPSAFMENFKSTYRQGNKILLSGKAIQPMYFISGEDYGRQVARSFQVLKNENKEYVIQGLEAYTTDQATEEYLRHYAKEKLVISRAPLGMLKLLGKFSRKIDYGYHIITALNNYPEKFEAEQSWKDLGKPVITLKEYAERG